MISELIVGDLISKLLSESPLSVNIYHKGICICVYSEDFAGKKTLHFTEEGRISPSYLLSELADLLGQIKDEASKRGT